MKGQNHLKDAAGFKPRQTLEHLIVLEVDDKMKLYYGSLVSWHRGIHQEACAWPTVDMADLGSCLSGR